MTCVCSLAGTAACKTCWHNPDSIGQYNNIVSWTTSSERTCKNVAEGYRYHFNCSLCGYDALIHNCEIRLDELPKYCPNCGAKVVSE